MHSLFHNKIFENVSALFILQIANYVLPLITFPYLVRVLGTGNFGVLAFSAAFIQYFVVLTDYGFNLSATRDVSINRDNRSELSKIFINVTAIKSIFAVISFGVIFILTRFIHKFGQFSTVYYLTCLAILGNVLFPVWFLQGLEKMKTVAIINITVRLLSTILIFILVKNINDLALAVLLINGTVVFSGLICVLLIHRMDILDLVKPSIKHIRELLAGGWAIFVSSLAVSLVGNTNIFLLGVITTDYKYVGIFSIAQKIVWAFANMVVPIANGIFPRVGLLFKKDRYQALKLLKRVYLFALPLFLFLSVFIYFGSDVLSKIVSGENNKLISLAIKIMSIIPLLILTDNIYGMQIMLNMGMEKKFMFIYLLSGVVLIITSLLLIPSYKSTGASISMLVTEIFILLYMYKAVAKKGINLFACSFQ
ncbi:MAG: flippase [Candidatus Edwardsbacteria bacterium]|nr:flippase [Candidatus Edwardsbacteria bacterium]